MGGLDSDTDTHIHWHPVDLRIGDQVTIEVIENCEGDEPDEFQINDPAKNKELAKQYIRDEAEKLGWTIVEND